MNTTDLTGKDYPDSKDSTRESNETPQPGDSILQPPKGNMGATSPADDDSQWDLPCGVGADSSPTM